MLPATDGVDLTAWQADQRIARNHLVKIMKNAVGFLERVDHLEAGISTPPGDYDGSVDCLASDFRLNRVYFCRLQSVWDDLQTALWQVGKSIEFIRVGALSPEQLEPVLIDKEIVLEQFVADRVEAMLASPGAANSAELHKLLETTKARISKLEAEQTHLADAPYFPNHWDTEADNLHHAGLHGWPYIDRAQPEEA